jgi:hypothetical protein
MAGQDDQKTDQTNKPTKPTESHNQLKSDSQRRASTDTTRTILPTYDSLATDTPPVYSQQPLKQPKPQEPTAGASAATIRAIMGDPIPEEPRRSLRDRLLGRRETYNRRPPSSERERGSSAMWNVWGSPVSDPHR